MSDRTRVPQAAYFREAVEDLLKKYEEPKRKGGEVNVERSCDVIFRGTHRDCQGVGGGSRWQTVKSLL